MLAMHIHGPARPVAPGWIARRQYLGVVAAGRQSLCDTHPMNGNFVDLDEPKRRSLDHEPHEISLVTRVPLDVDGGIRRNFPRTPAVPKDHGKRRCRGERAQGFGPMFAQPCSEPFHFATPVVRDTATVEAIGGGVPSPQAPAGDASSGDA